MQSDDERACMTGASIMTGKVSSQLDLKEREAPQRDPFQTSTSKRHWSMHRLMSVVVIVVYADAGGEISLQRSCNGQVR